MRGYMREHGISATWPAGERVLVCIGPNPAGARLVRAGKRMATSLKCDWTVLYVEAPGQRISTSDREALVQNLQLAEELGAQTTTLSGLNAPEEMLAFARAHNVTKIVVGKPTHSRWRDKVFGSTLDQLVRGSGEIDVYVISGDAAEAQRGAAPRAGRQSPLGEYVRAALVIAACAAIGFPLVAVLSVTDVAMLFLLGVVFVASRYGRGPSVLASVLSIVSFDFFFVPPRFTFAVSDTRYILTFAVMLAAALVASHLTLRIRAQAQTARDRERRTGAVYAMSRELAAARTAADLIAIATRHLADTFGAEMHILMPDATGRLESGGLDEKERSVAQWVMDHGQRAGAGTDTLPSASSLYVPLAASTGVIGVLGVRAAAPRFEDPTLLQLLETFTGQAALALERAQLAERAQQEEVKVEAERLRTSLLSSLSHDMRTPLGAITGAASSLLEESPQAKIKEPARRELLQSILDEANRMNRLIGNLLDMIRVESGALQVQKDWQPLEEPVGVALIRLGERLKQHPVHVALPPDLPLVPMDGVLIEQVFVNLLENAAKYTPASTPIDISAEQTDGVVRIDVLDRGPGIPAGEERRIFEKFYRVANEGPATGVGLGLTICRGIVTAHGGRIWAENRTGGGAAFHFTLPLSGAQPPAVPAEPAAQ